jgi:hypothetical protein
MRKNEQLVIQAQIRNNNSIASTMIMLERTDSTRFVLVLVPQFFSQTTIEQTILMHPRVTRFVLLSEFRLQLSPSSQQQYAMCYALWLSS